MEIKDYGVAKNAIRESSAESSVYIGADSIRYKKKGVWFSRYSTVIILHKDSCRGGNVFYHTNHERDYGNLRQRLMREVQFAIEAAEAVIDVVGNRHLEIHLDLNADPKHKSNIAVKEALGWVRGVTGIKPLIKPDAFAATHAADHVVRYKPMNS